MSIKRIHIIAAGAVIVLSAIALFQPMVDLAIERILAGSSPPPRAYTVSTRRGVEATMTDGIHLRADVHMPVGPDRAPTILIRIPFTKTFWNRLRSDAIARFWAARGYVVVVQGVRGRYDSDGLFVPLQNEREDGIATLRWLAQQPWYDGSIGMWGGSAFGQTQWAVADAQNPGVQAFFIQIASSRFFDVLHPGGAIALESALYWTLSSHGPRDRQVDYMALDSGAAVLATQKADDIAAGVDVAFFNDWIEAPRDSPYWRSSDGEDRASIAAAPMLLLGGWYDPFLVGMLDDFVSLRASPRTKESRLIIGPYTHASEIEWPDGGVKEPYRQGSIAPALAWFDHHLRRKPLMMPPVRLFVMGENVWRDENEWPLARTRYTPYYLHEGGSLSTAAPGTDGADQFAYDPRAPVLTAGGAMLGERSGIVRQPAVGARPDVLSFVTLPLEAPLEITGPLRAVLWVSTDAPSTDFTAKLCFIDKSGIAYNVADGIIRTEYQPMTLKQIEIVLGATSMYVPAGYRLRVDISSSNHPRFDRNPNTGESSAYATRTVIAHQTVWHTTVHPSHILLPVIPRLPQDN